MIRINLLKDRTAPSTVASQTTTFGQTKSGTLNEISVLKQRTMKKAAEGISSVGSAAMTVVKVMFLIVPTGALWGWSWTVVHKKELQLKKIEREIDVLLAEKQKLQPEVKAAEAFKEQKRTLGVKIEAIKQLSRERLRNVRALEKVQKIIPDKAWLDSLSIRGDNMEVQGMARDHNVISAFMDALKDDIDFKNPKLVSSQSQRDMRGTIQVFKIECMFREET